MVAQCRDCKGRMTYSIRCIHVLGFFAAKMNFGHKSARLLKSATGKRDPKKHLSLSVGICDRKQANRIPRPKVGISLVV